LGRKYNPSSVNKANTEAVIARMIS